MSESKPVSNERKSPVSPYASFLLLNLVIYMLDTTASYFQIYLKSVGLNLTQIGSITGTASLVALVFQPIFGAAADSAKSKNRILMGLLAITALLYPLLTLNHSMIYILVVYTAFVVFRRFQPSLNTTMSVEYSETSGKPYGPIRMMGAVGYACMMMFISWLAGRYEGREAEFYPITFYMFSGIALVCILIVTLMPVIKGHNRRSEGVKVSPLRLVKCKPVMTLILFQIMLSISSGFGNSYFSIYFTETMGGSNALYGTMLSIRAFVEIPFLFLSDKILKKLGTKRTLLILGLVTASRWYVSFFATGTTTLFIVSMFNFIGIMEGVVYSLTLSKMVAPRFKTSVQTLSATIQNVASILLSSYLGGFLADHVGIRPLYLVSAILVTVITVVFAGFILNPDENTTVFEG